MDIGSLRIFRAVAAEESVSRAADKLNCVQSNVTARLRQLEDELGALLFYRKKRGMILTPAGKTLLIYADKVIQLMNEAEIAVRETGAVSGSITIGATESAAAVRLPPVLSKYHRDYPEVEITISTGRTEGLIRSVLDYRLDAAFVTGCVEHPEVEQKVFVTEELVMVTESCITSIKAVEKPTLLVSSLGCPYRAVLENWLRQSGIMPYKIMEFGTLEGIIGCVSAGMGITVFPKSIIVNLNYLDKVNMLPMPAELANMPITFIRRRDALLTKAMSMFIETALEMYS
jgi:DNA-binding transcriptional LysR family regulator